MPRSSFIPVPDNTSKQVAKRIKRKDAMERAELFTARHLPKYLKRLEELANGIEMAEVRGDGETVVYAVAPDRQALQYLVDRGMGKVPQRVELTGDEGGPMEILPWASAGALTDVDDAIEGEFKEVAEGEHDTLEAGREGQDRPDL